MGKAYIIFTETIHDAEAMQTYSAAAAEASGAVDIVVTPLAIDGNPEVLEGEWPATQTVLLEFESVEAAKAWYGSDAYQAAIPLRQAAADTDVAILHGF